MFWGQTHLTSPAWDFSLPPRSSSSTPGTPSTLHNGTRTAALTSPGIAGVLYFVARSIMALWSVRKEPRVNGEVRDMMDVEGWMWRVDACAAAVMSVLDNISP
jgi:hypothetical protein